MTSQLSPNATALGHGWPGSVLHKTVTDGPADAQTESVSMAAQDVYDVAESASTAISRGGTATRPPAPRCRMPVTPRQHRDAVHRWR